jgi:hypothetical protein
LNREAQGCDQQSYCVIVTVTLYTMVASKASTKRKADEVEIEKKSKKKK